MAARCPLAWLVMPLGALGGGGLGCVLTLGPDLPAAVRPLGSRPRPSSRWGAGWARGQLQGQTGPPRSGAGRWPPSSRGRRSPLSLGKVTPHCTGWTVVPSRTEPCERQKVKGQRGQVGGAPQRGGQPGGLGGQVLERPFRGQWGLSLLGVVAGGRVCGFF